MSGLNKQEQFAIAAVARRFSATLEKSRDPAHARIIVEGKRVTLDIATLKPCGARQTNVARPHLRFDKVVIRLMDCLQATIAKTAPDGTTVLLTVTAPIRLASKTAAALEAKIHALLQRKSPCRDVKDTIHKNRIHIRILRGPSASSPKMIGFVHNPDSDPLLLLNLSQELLGLAGHQPRDAADGRSLARCAQPPHNFMLGGLPLHLFPSAHARHLQKNSHCLQQWSSRGPHEINPLRPRVAGAGNALLPAPPLLTAQPSGRSSRFLGLVIESAAELAL
ncbi:MAG TPA: hypothetical protein VGR81_04740 [Candidatus Acidoferrales bacterium]|nr:hypothetical protein [Candidatus Acidoferrales bacterium]